MRKVTQKEAEEWTTLAAEHGFVNDEGGIALGRFTIDEEESVDKRIVIRIVTPIIAPLYTHQGNKLKSPPILFDRTTDGQIIIPGRWWADMFDRMSGDSKISEPIAEKAFLVSRKSEVPDMFLPPSTDTISFRAPDENGQVITFEALPPGGKIVLNLVKK